MDLTRVTTSFSPWRESSHEEYSDNVHPATLNRTKQHEKGKLSHDKKREAY